MLAFLANQQVYATGLAANLALLPYRRQPWNWNIHLVAVGAVMLASMLASALGIASLRTDGWRSPHAVGAWIGTVTGFVTCLFGVFYIMSMLAVA